MSTEDAASADIRNADPGAASSAVDDLLQQAMQLHRTGQTEAARVLYEKALALQPENADGLHLYGLLQAQQGHTERAAELIGKAVAIKPLEPMFHNNLGNLAMGAERLDEAEEHYMRAYELDPQRLDVVNNIGVLQGRRAAFDEAEKTFLSLIEVAPGFSDARQNLANLYMRMGRVTDAVHQFALGLVTAPRNRSMRRLLGLAYGTLGLTDQAIELYRKWQAEEPDHPEPAHHLAALTGEAVPERASDQYVRAVFNSFANSFDAKLAELGYDAPRLTAQAVAEALGPPQGKLRVVDAGCGTGLCAPLLAPYAASMVGVDLSAGMLQKAAQRGAYQELVEADLTTFLAARPQAFDLLVSADTLCYFGRLDGFAAAARASLSAGGWLVFTVESHDDEADGAGLPGYRLQRHGRYSHRHDYVMQTLGAAGFEPPVIAAVVLRQEAGVPVKGWVVRAAVA